MLSRRQFLHNSSILGASMLLPNRLFAQIDLGEATLTTVSDGQLVLPGSFTYEGLPSDALAPVIEKYGLDIERVTSDCNLALYQDGTRNVLFDVGSGPDFMPSAGKILDSLDAAGLAPEDITDVVFTHAHPDHIWGVLDDFDEPLFYEAAYHMGQKEWDYWWDPDTVNSIGEARAAFAVGAKRRMEAIVDMINLVNPGDEVVPGVEAVGSYGHTPGHMSFDISGKALVVGDAIVNNHLAFEHPNWVNNSDQDAQMGMDTRLGLLDRLSAEKTPMIGYHLPNGGIGYVEKSGDRYTFISA